MNIRFLLTVSLSVFCVMIADAQVNMQDVLYLKNGSIIRGMIVHFIPDSTVKIQTIDGSIFVFSSLEIEKIQKEENPFVIRNKSDSTSHKKDNNVAACFFGGTAIPGSDWNDAANAGFTLGLQLYSKKDIGFLINLSYSSNPSPADENWVSFMALAGLKVDLKSAINMYFAPVAGLYVQKFPVIRVTGAAFAYGAIIGFQVKGSIGIGVQYIAANPKYEYGGYHFEVSSSLLQIFITANL